MGNVWDSVAHRLVDEFKLDGDVVSAVIADWREHGLSVRSLQEFHEQDQLRLQV